MCVVGVVFLMYEHRMYTLLAQLEGFFFFLLNLFYMLNKMGVLWKH